MEPINARDFNEAIGNNLKKGIALTVSIPSSIIGQHDLSPGVVCINFASVKSI